MTVATSKVHPTTVSTPPSWPGSSNHRPSTNPAFASTLREAALRWSGAAKKTGASG